MVARRLATSRRVFCASPQYLAKAGEPKTPKDLAKHNCLLLRFPGSQQWRWTLSHPNGREETLSLSGSMDSDNSGDHHQLVPCRTRYCNEGCI